ncbi:hypothetical protein PoB_006561800 [Plakobranchus ocellatus]|uniref:Uncharacterized protein n=1 Tax=Plakobranchus ocellatus TaxID=259542 RepID=A0AAV4D516_9GAST|nr:hypothetical protein PoB_006561800 [Plakobranchus ocellatus]
MELHKTVSVLVDAQVHIAFDAVKVGLLMATLKFTPLPGAVLYHVADVVKSSIIAGARGWLGSIGRRISSFFKRWTSHFDFSFDKTLGNFHLKLR